MQSLTKGASPFDYVLASHVVEHVPDFIGWLKEIHAVLRPGGILSLAIPDRRCCFDLSRRTSTVAEMIEAYLLKSRKPSPRQIYEYWSQIVHWEGRGDWSLSDEVTLEKVTTYHSELTAWRKTKEVFDADLYYDVHCWVFTASSFLEILRSLIALRLIDFRLVHIDGPFACEFLVGFEALECSQKTDDEIRDLQLKSLSKFS